MWLAQRASLSAAPNSVLLFGRPQPTLHLEGTGPFKARKNTGLGGGKLLLSTALKYCVMSPTNRPEL